MRATLLLLAVLWGSSVLPVAAQTTTSVDGSHPLKFEVPSTSLLFGRSPMLLLEQSNWVDLNYVRSMGVSVEPAVPGLADRALRVGSALVLRIDGGRVLRIFDLPDLVTEAGPVTHHFDAWLPESHYYVVSASCWHCRVTYLIDARDGRVANIDVPPVMSPSGRLGILWQLNWMDGSFGPRLIDLRTRPPALLGVPAGPNCDGHSGPRQLRPTPVWMDESRLEFTGTDSGLTHSDLSVKQVLHTVDGKPEWEC